MLWIIVAILCLTVICVVWYNSRKQGQMVERQGQMVERMEASFKRVEERMEELCWEKRTHPNKNKIV